MNYRGFHWKKEAVELVETKRYFMKWIIYQLHDGGVTFMFTTRKRSLEQGNVLHLSRGVCLWVRGVYNPWTHTPGNTTIPWTRTHPLDTPQYRWHLKRASFWNAFLLHFTFAVKHSSQEPGLWPHYNHIVKVWECKHKRCHSTRVAGSIPSFLLNLFCSSLRSNTKIPDLLPLRNYEKCEYQNETSSKIDQEGLQLKPNRPLANSSGGVAEWTSQNESGGGGTAGVSVPMWMGGQS